MPNQYVDNSHWCLVIKARCYFEKAQYKQAIDAFKKARALNSFLNFGLDWYSSALWQMKLESDLSYLSQELKKLDTFCPETWVVLGNTFSLQREHESALNYFSKSTEIDSSYAYGYTLAAHELIVTENYEKAIQLCRRALKENPRHYIAWYRLGSILSRQEKFDMALFHFKKAIDINPNNSVLFCSLAMAHHAKGDKVEAFNHYNKSCSLDPTNLVVKFQLAKLHSEIEEYEHALSLFKEILQVAPREAVVHYEIGLIFKRFNSMDKALQHLSISMDLDPKDRNLIKSAMDSLTQ
jgi:anaphase-promoting complex subunit 3